MVMLTFLEHLTLKEQLEKVHLAMMVEMAVTEVLVVEVEQGEALMMMVHQLLILQETEVLDLLVEVLVVEMLTKAMLKQETVEMGLEDWEF
jgi:hypothetical protein